MHWKLNKNVLFIAVIFIPCVVPATLLEVGDTKLLFNTWRVAAFIFIIAYMINKRQRITCTIVFSSLFSANLLLVTWRNGGNIKSATSIALMMFTIIALSEIGMTSLCCAKHYFSAISPICFFILLVDTAQILTGVGYSEINSGSWLGGDNFAVFTVIPMLGIILLGDYLIYGKVRRVTKLLFCLTMLAKFKTAATTSMIAFVTCVVLFWGFEYIKFSKNSRQILILLSVALIIWLCWDFTDIFVTVAELLGKNNVLEHGRIVIWKMSLDAILNEPILGHGVMYVYDETVALAGTYWPTCSDTHNYILELLFRGGMVGTLFYFLSMKDCFTFIIKEKISSKGIIILKGILAANFVLWISDSYYAQAPFYVLIVLCSHMKILKQYSYNEDTDSYGNKLRCVKIFKRSGVHTG